MKKSISVPRNTCLFAINDSNSSGFIIFIEFSDQRYFLVKHRHNGLLYNLLEEGSLFVSCSMTNPLKDELKKLDEEHKLLSDNIGQFESILMEYESDAGFFTRLLEDDDEKYYYAERTILIKQEIYRDYVRQRIKEHIGDPAAHNALSQSGKGALINMNSDIA